jgi:hypothetical protein
MRAEPRIALRILGALGLFVFATAVPARAEDAVDLGDLVVLDVDGAPLRNGGSATEFSLQMPPDATCPGDSMSDQWRVQSFVAPAADDIGSLHYGVIGPDGPAQYALFAVDTKPFAHQLTLANAAAGQPGRIGGVPLMSFAVMTPGLLPAGRYRIGIACTLFGATAHYWDTEIVLEDSPGDVPAQFTWRLPDAPLYQPPEPWSSPWRWVGGVLVLGGVFVVGWALVSRSRSARPTAEESS